MPLGRGSAFTPALGGMVHAPTINLNIGQGEQPNDFQTIQNVKNQPLQSAIDSVLKQGSDLSTDFTKNPFTLRTNVKDQEQQDRISAAGGRFNADVTANRQSLEDFTKNYLAANGQAKNYTDQETNAIGNIYGQANDPNSMAYNLAKIRKDKELAMNREAQNTLRSAMARSKMNSLMGVNDSSVDAAMADAASRIGASTAGNIADQNRNDYMSVMGAQTSMAGRRGALLDDYLKRSLVPANMRMQMGAGELGQLGQIGQMNNANNVYTMDSQDQMLSRKLGLLGQYSDLDLKNNFYGLRKPYSPNNDGYYISDPGGRGGMGNPASFNPGLNGYNTFNQPQQGGGLPPWAQAQRQQQARTMFPMRPGMNNGSGSGLMGNPDGSYDLSGNFNWGDPNIPSDLRQPGWNPNNVAALQDYYENPENYQ